MIHSDAPSSRFLKKSSISILTHAFFLIKGETIRSMVARLLDKRALRYTSFDVFVQNSEKPLDLSEDSTSLGCTEVRVEPRVLFRLELPSKKSIGVKAKPAKLVKEVLGPILNQYGWSLEAMSVRRDVPNSHGGHVDPEMVLVDLEATVASIDNSRLLVAPKSADINSDLLRDLLRSKSVSVRKTEHEEISRASSVESLERIRRMVRAKFTRFYMDFLQYVSIFFCRKLKMRRKCHHLRPFRVGDQNLTNLSKESRKVSTIIFSNICVK